MRKKTAMQYKKPMLVFLASMLMLLATALSSFAAFECNVSSVATTIQGGSTANGINISYSGSQIAADATNMYAEVYIFSSSTANSSSTLTVFNVSNSTLRNAVNITFPVHSGFVFEDSNDYQIQAVVWNGTVNTKGQGATNKTPCRNATGFTIDRSAPTAPSALGISGTQSSADLTFSSTVTGTATTGCTLMFSDKNPGSAQYSMTHSANSCSYSLTGVPQGSYDYVIRASDGTNISDTASTQFAVDIPTTAAKKAAMVNILNSGGASALQISGSPAAAGTPAFDAKGTVNTVKSQFTDKSELTKVGIGAGVGAVVGMGGFALGPLGVITVPVGALIGGFIGAIA